MLDDEVFILLSDVVITICNSEKIDESVLTELDSEAVFEEVIVESVVATCLVCKFDDIPIVSVDVSTFNPVKNDAIVVSDVVCFDV